MFQCNGDISVDTVVAGLGARVSDLRHLGSVDLGTFLAAGTCAHMQKLESLGILQDDISCIRELFEVLPALVTTFAIFGEEGALPWWKVYQFLSIDSLCIKTLYLDSVQVTPVGSTMLEVMRYNISMSTQWPLIIQLKRWKVTR